MTVALIIDDEKDIRELIEMAFISLGIQCELADCVKAGLRKLKDKQIDFCITDMRLPDGDGMDIIRHIQHKYPDIPVCVITAHGNVDLAVEALKLGAFDFVNKPFDLKQLRGMAEAASKLVGSEDDSKDSSSNQLTTNQNKPIELIGESSVMKKLEQVIHKLGRSQAPVFIHGESGTGKELVAKSIHLSSARKDGPFIPVNCGAIPENLVESEFFGYKKGAFTGANKDHAGLFTSANGGTLFLDEVADLPLAMQVKLLRAIQERAVRPIGGDKELSIDVRILSATHKNLSELVQQGQFREDLYYRLNVIALGMPPLRKRDGDIRIISEWLVEKLAKLHQLPKLKLTSHALKKLESYDYPGNVRELENILERAVTFCENQTIEVDNIQFSSGLTNEADEGLSIDLTEGDLSNNDFSDNYDFSEGDSELEEDTTQISQLETPSLTNDLEGYLETVEKQAIMAALKATDNNKTKAAEKLGISFRAFRYKLQKYDIK